MECHLQETASNLCSAGAAGVPELLVAFQSGGDAARAALAAIIWGSCSYQDALPSVWRALFAAPEISDSSKVLP